MKLDLSIIDKNIKTIVIGVSAGPDSMALLHYLENNTNYQLICAHINHNVRPESKAEETYLKTYCQEHNIIFESFTINEYNETNFENEARKKRYDFYHKILAKYNTNYLLLAHHGDDLIETVLMKIARGSNLEGYAGIKKVSKIDNIYIIRPLLDYTKNDLLQYNKDNNIKYFIDKSNDSDLYTRNRYRKYVLPFLKKEDNNIHKKFIKYSKTLLEYDNYIKKETIKITNNIYIDNCLNLDEFNILDKFMQKNILYYILNNIYDNNSNIVKEKHIYNIINICKNNKNAKLNLPHNIIVVKEYNCLKFNLNKPNENYKIKFNQHFEKNNHIIKKINTTTDNGNNICKLNSNNIKLPLYIRNIQNGDKIIVLGMNKHKKVNDILMENKIPPSQRKQYPIVVDDNDNVLWVPNLKKSNFNTKNNEFYDIILEYCEKEEK